MPVLPGTITPDSMPPEQLEDLLALFQSGEARLVGPHGEEHLVPAALYRLMRGLLSHQQAAQILNISWPYLYRLLEQNAVPVVMVGSHRRLFIHDVPQLREERQQRRRSALDELNSRQG